VGVVKDWVGLLLFSKRGGIPLLLETKRRVPIFRMEKPMREKTDVLQGTLILMVLKTLNVLGPMHGWGMRDGLSRLAAICWR